MRVQVDFSDVQSFEAVPPGLYTVNIDQLELCESRSSEHPYINWSLTITEGEHANRKLWMITSLSPKALYRLQDVLTSFGLDDKQFELEVDDGTGIILEPALSGMAAEVKVENEMYNGKPQNRVVAMFGGVETAVPTTATATEASGPTTETATAEAAPAAAPKANPFRKPAGAAAGRSFK